MSKWRLFFDALYGEFCVLVFIDRSRRKYRQKTECEYRQPNQENSPSPHRGISPFTYASPCPVCYGYPKDTNKLSIEWIKPRAELVGILVALFLAIFAYRQMGANMRQAEAADKQLREMQNAREMDERAWVSAYDLEAKSDDQKSACFQILFKNTGKTPAINIRAVLSYNWSTNGIPETDQFKGDTAKGSMLPPGTVGNINTPVLPETEIAAIQQGRDFYVYGTIWYDDVFGSHHWNQFCFQMWKTLRASVGTGFHNGCDTQLSQTGQK